MTKEADPLETSRLLNEWLRTALSIDDAANGAVPDLEAGLEALDGEVALLVGQTLLDRNELAAARELLLRVGASDVRPELKSRLALQLVRLATALEKQTSSDNRERVTEVLERACTIDPAKALPARARYLERSGQVDEAIASWQSYVRLMPNEISPYIQLSRLLETQGLPEAAFEMCIRSVKSALGNPLLVSARLDALDQQLSQATRPAIRVAILGNSTLDQLAACVKLECYSAGLRPTVYQCKYDQYAQEALDPDSALYKFRPDVVILAIHASRLFPTTHAFPFDLTREQRLAEVDAGLGTVRQLLDAISSHTSALILLHNMVAPQNPALGTLDWRDEPGQNELFGEINARLAHMAREQYASVYIVDEDAVQGRVGKQRATDVRLWHTARMGWSDMMTRTLCREYMRFIRPYRGLSRKCIVLDLDNTVWGGVIGEDGFEGIQVGPDAPGSAFVDFQQALDRLSRRGVLLAVCSKNNEEDVLPVLQRHPNMILRDTHFVARRINWRPKAQNIREIAAELNIGMDSIVFIDDNPVERAAVRAELPDVLVPELPSDPALYRSALLDLGMFDTLAVTDEDRRRTQLYEEQRARREFEAARPGSNSLQEYLQELDIVVDVDIASEATLARAAQLTGKTNQFNLTTRRYSEAELRAKIAEGIGVYTIRVVDRFGDNGIVGVAIISTSADGDTVWEIDTFLLSCRVMGRGVESALLSFLTAEARRSGAKAVRGWYKPTVKNEPARDCYCRHGFTLVEEGADGAQLWELDVSAGVVSMPAWLRRRSDPAA